MVTIGPEDYPRTLREFEQRFAIEKACSEYLVTLRWPSGFACPACNATVVWRSPHDRLECARCY